MSRRKLIIAWLIGSVLCLTACFSAWAGTGGGVIPKRNGQTEVQAGVVVDYMGKLRFAVLKRGTLVPIPGASVEIYIDALDRYVLFGLTDADGIYELDVAYNMDLNTPDSTQFTENEGSYTFESPLYLSSNSIRYRIYKEGWLPHPSIGETMLGAAEFPQVITIYLYQQGGGGGGTTPDISTGGSIINSIIGTLQSILDSAVKKAGMNSGAIPKTGVEGTMHFWLLGFVFFLLAGGIVCILLKKDKESTKGERSK